MTAGGGSATAPVIEGRGLSKAFVTRRSVFGVARESVLAVDNVSLEVGQGQTLGIVGESGSGKSTVARLLLHLVRPDKGTVLSRGAELGRLKPRELRAWRRNVQMIFQDPFTSMNPRMTIGQIVSEPFRVHGTAGATEIPDRVEALLKSVGVPVDSVRRRPESFSGGQLQRIAIARALACDPEVLICDESVAALDVSIRGQILNLLRDLQSTRGIAIVFISHDLSLVRALATNVLVMLHGKSVEFGAAEKLFSDPQHAYTRRLLQAIPVADPVIQQAKYRDRIRQGSSDTEASASRGDRGR